MKKAQRAAQALLNRHLPTGHIPLDLFVGILPIAPEAMRLHREALKRKGSKTK